MGTNDKIAATFHPWTDAELITAARDWPADWVDRTIILDLADALERHVEETPGNGDQSGQEVTAND